MTYISKPVVTDNNIYESLNPAKVSGTAATRLSNTLTGLMTTPGITVQSMSQKYTTVSSTSTITPSQGLTIEVGSGYTGNLALNHSFTDQGTMLIIKNTRGTDLTIQGSSPSTSSTANGGPVSATNNVATSTVTTTGQTTTSQLLLLFGSTTIPSSFAIGDYIYHANLATDTQITGINNTGTARYISINKNPIATVPTGAVIASRELKFASSPAGFNVGDSLSGTNVPSGATISYIGSGGRITMSTGVTTGISAPTLITANRYYITLTATNSNILLDQVVSGTGIATGTQVKYITGTQIGITKLPTAALSSTNVTFQSFIDWTKDANNNLLPGGSTITLPNQQSVRLISTGAYWIIVGGT